MKKKYSHGFVPSLRKYGFGKSLQLTTGVRPLSSAYIICALVLFTILKKPSFFIVIPIKYKYWFFFLPPPPPPPLYCIIVCTLMI